MAVVHALVADDHPMCRQAEALALTAALDDCRVAEASTLADAMAKADGADLILLDLGMPDGNSMAGLLAIAGAAPRARVLVVTGNEAPGLGALVRAAGGCGLVSKSAPLTNLVGAIHAVIHGESWFPERASGDPGAHPGDAAMMNSVTARMATLSVAERRILGAMCDGSLNKQIAFRFGLSEITVKQHVKAVLRKLQAVNRTQAAMMMQFHGGAEALPL